MVVRQISNPKRLNYGFCVDNPIYYYTIVDWCYSAFGDVKAYHPLHKYPPRWTARSDFKSLFGKKVGWGYIYFIDEEDAVAFKLKWVD